MPECGELLDVDKQAIDEFKNVKADVEQYLEQFKFREAQKEAMNLARIGNRYITECEPWKVAKGVDSSQLTVHSEGRSEAANRVATILHVCLQLTANLAIAFEPFLPFSSKKLREMLNLDSFSWEQLGSMDILKAGHQLAEPSLLFEKIEDSVIEAQLKKLDDVKKANEAAAYEPEPVKENVDFETFEKIDIRVGLVTSCEKVKKSKKLLKFHIDDGTPEGRTILSGIAAYYEDPQELVGKQVLFVANFAPRQMMGEESQGMILSAVDFDGSLSVATTSKNVKPGSQVG